MWLKINSHRARQKVDRTGIKYVALVCWPSMEHYYLTTDFNKEIIQKIKGVSIFKNRPKGEFTRTWKPENLLTRTV